jgi:hypothetical protein
VTITESEIVVVRLRRRHIAWPRVQRVSQTHPWGGRNVVLTLDTGARLSLPAPRWSWPSRSTPDFDGKFRFIGQWWLDHRGPDWQPIHFR